MQVRTRLHLQSTVVVAASPVAPRLSRIGPVATRLNSHKLPINPICMQQAKGRWLRKRGILIRPQLSSSKLILHQSNN